MDARFQGRRSSTMHLMATKKKDETLNFRISPELKNDIRRLATYRGLSVSSYVHYLLVKAVRLESHAQQIELRELEMEDVPIAGTVNKTKENTAHKKRA